MKKLSEKYIVRLYRAYLKTQNIAAGYTDKNQPHQKKYLHKNHNMQKSLI